MVLDPAVLPLAWAGGGVVRWLGRPPQVETGGRPFVSPKVSGYGLLFSFAGGSPLGPEIVQPTSSPLTISLKSSIPLPQDPYVGGHPILDGRRLGQSAVGRTYTWPSGRPGSARHEPVPGMAQRMSGRHGTRASRAVPSRASYLTKGPGTTCWAVFWAGLAREGTACQACQAGPRPTERGKGRAGGKGSHGERRPPPARSPWRLDVGLRGEVRRRRLLACLNPPIAVRIWPRMSCGARGRRRRARGRRKRRTGSGGRRRGARPSGEGAEGRQPGRLTPDPSG